MELLPSAFAADWAEAQAQRFTMVCCTVPDRNQVLTTVKSPQFTVQLMTEQLASRAEVGGYAVSCITHGSKHVGY